MVNLSPCESLNRKIDALMGEFNLSTSKVTDSKNILNDTLDSMKTQVGITDLEDKVNAARNTASSELGSVISPPSNIAGSCLDSLRSSAFEVLNNASSYSTEAFSAIDGITNVSNLMNQLGNVKSLVEGLGIGKLLEKIDQTLGCLADNNDCIPTDKIETIMTTVSNTLDSIGLGETGSFDVSKVLDNIPDFDAILKQNIVDLDTAADALAEESKAAIESSLKTANKYYDPSKW